MGGPIIPRPHSTGRKEKQKERERKYEECKQTKKY
jgi:hypothetical protein